MAATNCRGAERPVGIGQVVAGEASLCRPSPPPPTPPSLPLPAPCHVCSSKLPPLMPLCTCSAMTQFCTLAVFTGVNTLVGMVVSLAQDPTSWGMAEAVAQHRMCRRGYLGNGA